MLASQSIHRTINTGDLPNKTLFYRALLEILFMENSIKSIQIGKIKCENFIDYIRKCSIKHNLNFDKYSDNYLNDFEKKYENNKKLLDVFYFIRMNFAPILEAIILIDRILYLKENNIKNVYLTKLFDPIISPRCYGIIGIK